MLRTAIVGVAAASLLAGAAPAAQAQGLGSLGNIFRCDRQGSNQTGGAVIGGVLGGLAGAGVARNDALGAILGGALGAAAGSWIGCRLGGEDRASLQDATLRALNENRSTTWSNPRTGASAQINVLADTSGGGGYTPGSAQPISAQSIRLGSGVSWAAAYETAPSRFSARSNANLRAAPSTQAPVLGQLYRGEQIEAIARVQGQPWILVGRNGLGVGYVHDSTVSPLDSGSQYAYNNQGAASNCRLVEQVITTQGAAPQTQRYRACRDATGNWNLATV